MLGNVHGAGVRFYFIRHGVFVSVLPAAGWPKRQQKQPHTHVLLSSSPYSAGIPALFITT